jgi:hypothetical protein
MLCLCICVDSDEKRTLNQKEFETFWDWIGPGLKKIRYQKYLLWLFENGYLSINQIKSKFKSFYVHPHPHNTHPHTVSLSRDPV